MDEIQIECNKQQQEWIFENTYSNKHQNQENSFNESNGGGVKYKIIDTDGSELDISMLLEKYFFNDGHHTSCSVIFTKLHNNTIEQYSMIEQTKDSENKDIEKIVSKVENEATSN